MNRAIISDIVLWIALAVLLTGGIYTLVTWLPQKRGEVIVLHFRDANEIGRGSLVRMMGTEIGFVDSIRLKHDHVDIVVRTYPGTLKIPSGAMFTVQFTGLVGAKSIEVVPPAVARPPLKGKTLYLVEEPLRLKDNMKYQMDILQDLQQGAENIADFFGKKKPVEELQVNIQQAHEWSDKSVVALTETNNNLSRIRVQLNASTGETVTGLQKFTQGTRQAVVSSRPENLQAHFNAIIETMIELDRLLIAEDRAAAGMLSLHDKALHVNSTLAHTGVQLQQAQHALQPLPTLTVLDRVIVAGGNTGTFLAHLDRLIHAGGIESLQSARTAIQHFNATLLRMGETLDRQALQEQKKAR